MWHGHWSGADWATTAGSRELLNKRTARGESRVEEYQTRRNLLAPR